MVYSNLTDIIGKTPLLEIGGLEGQQARILAKLEFLNPGGSVKDRTAMAMIADAEERGLLKPGATIIEPTSGNTGVGLAWVGKARGYRTILTMPDTMSKERCTLLKAYGAEIILTPGAEGMAGSIKKADALKAEIPGSVILGQFENPANPRIHELTTAREIWEDTQGQVDIFVAGIGTGGTLCGTGIGLKKHRSDIQIVGVEPYTSPLITKGYAGAHGLQGIGANFIPKTYNPDVVDKVMTVTDADAFAATRFLASERGLFAGITSGAAFHAASELARQPENAGKTIVTLLPDSGDRYLSTGIF